MDTGAVHLANGANTAGNVSALTGSSRSIADNFNTFLSLLTTQLKNQNPLDPLDTNQFTQQMVQFTSVEQQLKTNEFLKTLAASAQNATNTEAVSFIGKQVTAAGASAELSNGSASWEYSLNRTASDTTITIRDSNGAIVHTDETSLASGTGNFSWDGRDAAGNQLPDGNYSITINARDGNGSYVPVTTQVTGLVSGVDLSGNTPILLVGGAQVNMSSVLSVQAAATS
ncbi:MAG: flagellar hook assembly protein FlgD [Devosiaceae bacterium]|nr:flagellar hook assembly protein FlgD [Devosiaceae bacterium]